MKTIAGFRRGALAAGLWLLCHPATSATFNANDFLAHRYPNRHLLMENSGGVRFHEDDERRKVEGSRRSSLSNVASAIIYRVQHAMSPSDVQGVLAHVFHAQGALNGVDRAESAVEHRGGANVAHRRLGGEKYVTPAFVGPASGLLRRPSAQRILGGKSASSRSRPAASCPCLHTLDAVPVRGSDAADKPRRRRPGARMLFGRTRNARVVVNSSNFSKSSSLSDFAATSNVKNIASSASSDVLSYSAAFRSSNTGNGGGGGNMASVSISTLGSGGEEKSGAIGHFLRGAASAIDDAVSFFECKLVTSDVGRRLLEPQLSGAQTARRALTTPATLARVGPSEQDHSFDLVGFMDVSPFDAAARGGGGSVW